jgi:pyridoxamine 5'-phosphate oxidase|tara:strand:- start:152 stop:292 length:141 start_codon:yes stop_codon:yes gene_type:complete
MNGQETNDFKFTMKESEARYENITVIQCKIKSIEWLYLVAKGHRRA